MSRKKFIARLQRDYYRVLEKSFILSLLLFCALFYNYQHFDTGSVDLGTYIPPVIVEEIERTKQEKPKPQPAKPVIPVETEQDEFLDDVPIDFLDLQQNWLEEEAKLPTITDEEPYEFYAVSEKPILVKRVSPEYPSLAQNAGIEGTVVVTVLIGKDGTVEDTKIYKSIPMLDQSALAAAKELKFKPGKQRDKYVRVWMNVPFKFSIRSSHI